MSNLRDRLNAVLIAKFDLEPGTLAADPTLESLDLDSLAIVQLAVAMEREFGVEFDEEELTERTTVGDIVGLLGDRLSGDAARLGHVRAGRPSHPTLVAWSTEICSVRYRKILGGVLHRGPGLGADGCARADLLRGRGRGR